MKLTQALLLICLVGFVYSQLDVCTDASDPEFACDGIEFVQSAHNKTSATPEEPSYSFDDPEIAYQVLGQLDVFKPLDDSYFRTHTGTEKFYDEVFQGIKKAKRYCERHRAFFVDFPEFIFRETNYVADHHKTNFVKDEAFSPIAYNVHPEVGYHMSKEESRTPAVLLKPNIHFFFTTGTMFEHLHIGKHFSCLTQASNHIPGHWSICRKDFAAESVIKYAKQYENRPQCFSQDKFFPKTWLLYQKESCEEFFAEFNSPQYQIEKKEHRIVYIRKIAVWSHRGDGVQPVNNEEEDEIRATYDNGKLCGSISEVVVMQRYVPNPLLINGRKFDFRMFTFIASMNPLIAYFYDGGLRVSLIPYDVNSDDKRTLLTNFALNHEIYKTARKEGLFEGKTEEELKLDQQWTFKGLEKYLLDSGKITDPNWLDNYLRPQFKLAFIHLIRLARHSYLNTSSSVYEFYGTDFMLDDQMNIWFIESNSGPAFGGYTEETGKIIGKTLRDHVEIVMGLLRSRTKRIIVFVNKLVKEGQVQRTEDGQVQITNLEERIREFENITRNYFEKEFEPSATNGFVKIIDENLEGADAYLGYLPAECL